MRKKLRFFCFLSLFLFSFSETARNSFLKIPNQLTELQRIRQAHWPRDRVVTRRELCAPLPEVGGVQEKAKRRRRGRREGCEGEVDEELPGGL